MEKIIAERSVEVNDISKRLSSINGQISDISAQIRVKTIERDRLDLILRGHSTQIKSQQKRRQEINQRLYRLIRMSTRMEANIRIKTHKKEFRFKNNLDPKLQLMSQKSNQFTQMADSLAEEESRLQQEVKQLETELENMSRLEEDADKAVLEIPILRQSEKKVETDLQMTLKRNTDLKMSNKKLSSEIKIETKRNEAIIRRYNIQKTRIQSNKT